MKRFSTLNFDTRICRQQVAELKQLLQSRQSLSELDDIIPFFKARQQLSALVGSYHAKIIVPDRIAFEYDIFGDFRSDLVVGDFVSNSYCFVEFEDATANSIFVSKSSRSIPDWSPRLDRGFNQILDWFWKLNDFERTEDFENRFNSRSIDYIGLLVIGRDKYLEPREKKRLDWRRKKLIVNSMHVQCITFDELYANLSARLDKYRIVMQGEN